jgi:hypothetical protein
MLKKSASSVISDYCRSRTWAHNERNWSSIMDAQALLSTSDGNKTNQVNGYELGHVSVLELLNLRRITTDIIARLDLLTSEWLAGCMQLYATFQRT